MNDSMEFLDILTVLGFCAQLKNMEEDKLEKEYIHSVIQQIGEEIDKLHKENDIIMEKIDQLLRENQ